MFPHRAIPAESCRATGPYRRRAGGFSLIEVAIATLVIGILVASILSTVTHGFSILARSRQTLRANQILQQDIETIRTYSWSQMTNAANFGSSNYYDGSLLYVTTRSITNYSNSTSYGTNYMKKVTVSITWTNAPGKVVNKTMTTLFTQGGLNDYLY